MKDINRTLLTAVIVLSAIVLLGLGYFIGTLSGSSKTEITEEATEEVAAEAGQEVAAAAEEKQEKTYGYYPSFYVKRIYYSVPASEGYYTVNVYTDGATKFVDSNTDCRWLKEEDLGEGGKQFKVKANRDKESRKGQVFLYDNKGRKIALHVTQKGKND